jgi:hypothetical protein
LEWVTVSLEVGEVQDSMCNEDAMAVAEEEVQMVEEAVWTALLREGRSRGASCS